MARSIVVLVAAEDAAARAVVIAAIKAAFDVWIAEARDGAETLRWLEKVLPALIYLDLRGSDVDCFEVCRRIKARPLTATIPVVIACADRDRPRLVDCGCDAILGTPVDRGALVDLISRRLPAIATKGW